MSSSPPPENSSSSFVYPIKSLLSGIQPHRDSTGSASSSPNHSPDLTRSATLGLSSPLPESVESEVGPSAGGSAHSRSFSTTETPTRSQARRSQSIAGFSFEGPTTKKPRKNTRADRPPNFRHYPAGDENPNSPRSFSANPSGTSPPITAGSRSLPQGEFFRTDNSAVTTPDEYPYDARHPPPLPLIAGQAFSATSGSLLPTGEGKTPPYERPWNVSNLSIVHLPPLPASSKSSSRAGSSKSKPSVDKRSTSQTRSNSSSQQTKSSSNNSRYYTPEDFSGSDGDRMGVSGQGNAKRHPSSSAASSSGISATSEAPLATVRFQYIKDENGHHVVTGREGQFAKCEDEPIRTPGAVQGFGVLIVVEELEDRLLVRQVSENSTELLGLPPKYLFSLECFTDTLPESQASLLWDNIQFLSDPTVVLNQPSEPTPSAIEDASSDDSEVDAPHVFLISGYGAPGTGRPQETTAEPHDPWGPQSGRRRWTCWCAAHRPHPTPYLTEAGPNVVHRTIIVLEFELEIDMMNPLYPPPEPALSASSKSSVRSGTSSSDSTSSGSGSPGSGSASSGSKSGGNSSDRTLVQAEGIIAAASSSTLTLSGDSPSSQNIDVTSPALQQTDSSDSQATLGPLTGRTTSDVSPSGLDSSPEWSPTTEEILESTTSRSKPLVALERLRRLSKMPGAPNYASSSTPGYVTTAAKARRANRRSMLGPDRNANVPGAVGMMDVFAVMAEINEQLGTAPDLDTFLKIVVGLIKDLTQFHRVLVYQFDEMWNGQTVAELVDWSQTHDLYMGLHFPASDIPAQARELYKHSKVRILYDRDQPTARLVVRSKEDLENPLNMTHCYLRAMSPIHIKYLANMSVRASMSVSIMAFGTLWGLVACHSYGVSGMRVSFPVRQMLRLLSQSISRNIERLSYAQRLHTRKLINTISSDNHPTGYIVSNADDLLGLFDADFGILVVGDGAKILGPNEHGQEILIMAEYLRLKQFNSIQVSQAVTADFPDLNISTGLEVVAGLLYVPLSSGGKDFIAFLRKGQPRHVHWAGKPYKPGSEGSAVLEPRRSFKIWSEKVAGRCRVWTDEQLETAGVLALVYGKFIEVWRQKESALATTKLHNLLLSNASHEVRTPLNHIINYLEMALNGPLDGETRDNLSHSYTASKSLLFTINDLLDLTRLESGNETSFNEPFDLHNIIEEATLLYKKESHRLGLEFKVESSNIPKIVVGDSRKIKTVIQNLTANALKYTKKGSITVQCKTYEEPEGLRSTLSTAVEIVVADTGCGIPPAKLESIFREFEQVESSEPKATSEPGVGLGLAVVARIVEQLGGRLRVESKVDEGSRFSFLIPLSLDLDGVERRSNSSTSGSSLSSLQSRPISSGDREIASFVEALSSNHMSGNNSPRSSRSLIEPSASPSQQPPNTQGTFPVTDSSIPVRPVKKSDAESPALRKRASASGFSTGELRAAPVRPVIDRRHSSDTPSTPSAMHPTSTLSASLDRPKLRVLIVEDNDINRTILAKRLRMDGHTVVNTTNGQEGVDQVKGDRDFDCILMDINMPILNGFEASEQIREVEKAETPTECPNSETQRLSLLLNGRIPIFAVSASLFEQQRDKLSNAGMDGWILKPIDFKRLAIILSGVTDLDQRERDRYHPGYNWEIGGWLAETRGPSRESSVSLASIEDVLKSSS